MFLPESQVRILITADNITYKKDDITILSDVSFQIRKGKILGVAGPDHSGKTTLLMILMGFVKGYEGSISWHSHEQKDGALPSSIRRQFRFVPDHLLNENDLTGREFLEWARSRSGNYSEELEDSLCDVFNLDILKKIDEMSYDEKKNLELIAAVSHRPAVLILDEPFNFMKSSSVVRWRHILKKLGASCNIIIASEEKEELSGLADRVLELKKNEEIDTEGIQEK